MILNVVSTYLDQALVMNIVCLCVLYLHPRDTSPAPSRPSHVRIRPVELWISSHPAQQQSPVDDFFRYIFVNENHFSGKKYLVCTFGSRSGFEVPIRIHRKQSILNWHDRLLEGSALNVEIVILLEWKHII